MRNKPIILNTIAKTLNAGGSALVSVFDAGAGAFNTTMSALSPGEKTKLRTGIKTLEKKIQTLYGEIGKETSKYPDPSAALESASVQAILGAIRELTLDIETMKQRIVDLDKVKAEKTPPAPKKAPQATKSAPQATKGTPQAAKNAPPESGGVAAFFIHSLSNSLAGILSMEKVSLQRKIAPIEKKIQELYVEIAKETAKCSDPATALTSAPVVGLLAKVHDLKAEIAELTHRIVDIAEGKKADKAPSPVKAKIPVPTAGSDENDVQKADQPAGEIIKAGEEVIVASSAVAVAVVVTGTTSLGDSEPVETASIGYDRSKPCLTPTPTLQPPTREEFETATRSPQVEEPREESIDAMPEEHAAVAVVAVATEAAPVSQGTDAEIIITADENTPVAVSVAVEPETTVLSEDSSGREAEQAPMLEEPVNKEVEAMAVVHAGVQADTAAVSGDGRELTDAASIGYDRTRPCLIRTPTPQPPTRKDIETAIRRLQEGDTREERIREILEEHAAVAVVATATEEAPAQEEADSNSSITADQTAPAEVAAELETNVVSEDAAGSDAEDAPLPEEQEAVQTAVEEEPPVAEIVAEPETSVGSEDVAGSDADETPLPDEQEAEQPAVEEEPQIAEVVAEPEMSGVPEEAVVSEAEETPLLEEQEAQTAAEYEPPVAEVAAEPETSEDASGSDAEETPLPEEQEAEQSATEEEPPVAEVAAEPETSGVSEEATGSDAEETPWQMEQEFAQTATEEVPPVAEVAAEHETSGASEDAAGGEAEETPLRVEQEAAQTAPEETLSGEGLTPEHEKKKIALQFEDEIDKNRWKSIMTSPDEFSIIRTRSHTAAFASLPDGKTDNPGQESKPEMNSGNDSGPEFRSRVHQPTYAATPADLPEISPQEEAVVRVEDVIAGRVKSAERHSNETEQYAQLKKEAQKKSQHRPVFTKSEVIANNARKSNPKRRG